MLDLVLKVVEIICKVVGAVNTIVKTAESLRNWKNRQQKSDRLSQG